MRCLKMLSARKRRDTKEYGLSIATHSCLTSFGVEKTLPRSRTFSSHRLLQGNLPSRGMHVE